METALDKLELITYVMAVLAVLFILNGAIAKHRSKQRSK